MLDSVDEFLYPAATALERMWVGGSEKRQIAFRVDGISDIESMVKKREWVTLVKRDRQTTGKVTDRLMRKTGES